MTKGQEQMAKIHLECGRRLHELEQALLDATNFISHMHNSRIETEGEGCLTDIGVEWVNEWQDLIQNDLKRKQVIKPNNGEV